jgi:hypothetical protein
MSAKTERTYIPDWLLDEFGAPNYCREEKILASGQNLASGSVIASGSGATVSAFVHDDGTYGTASGILLEAVNAASGALPCVCLMRGPAVVSKAKLFLHADNDSTEIAIALAALLVLGIVAREGV